MKEKKYLSLPVEFVENQKFSFDDSLIPVDIKVMHDGLNLNNSTFFEEAIEQAKESLKNKPILGYIKKGEGNDDIDFAGHEMEVVSTEEGFKVVYLERPLGTVPESNNYSVQVDDDGRSFVHCRGYIWKEYLNDGYEILQNNPNKSVSMEIAVDDYDINEDGSLNIIKYRYLGITILGDDVLPGMDGAEMSVVGQFEKNNNTLYSKMENLNKSLELHFGKELKESVKGGENVDIEERDEIEVEEEFVEIEETSVEEKETPIGDEEMSTEVSLPETGEVAESDVEEVMVEEEPVEEGFETEEVEEEAVIDEPVENNIEPEVEDDATTEEEVVVEVETEEFAELQSKYTSLETEFDLLKTEITELREFKSNALANEKLEAINEIFANYSTVLDKSDMEDLVEGAMDMELEALEKELSFRLVKKKFDFSKSTKKDSTKLPVMKDANVEIDPYGSASIYFNK